MWQLRQNKTTTRRQQKNARRYFRLSKYYSWAEIAIPVIYLTVMCAMRFGLIGSSPAFGFTFFMVSAFLLIAFSYISIDLLWSDIALQIAQTRDLSNVGLLLEAFSCQDKRIRRSARNALLHLMPHFCEDDASLLDASQRLHLYSLLLIDDEELCITTLKLLERVHFVQALPYVKKFTEGQGSTKRSIRTQREAQQCLLLLAQWAHQQRHSQTLLRGSTFPIACSDILVRPASGNTKIDHEQLLRANLSVHADENA